MSLPRPSEVPRVALSDAETKSLHQFLVAPWSPAEWNNGRALDAAPYASGAAVVTETLRAAGWKTAAAPRGKLLLVLPA